MLVLRRRLHVDWSGDCVACPTGYTRPASDGQRRSDRSACTARRLHARTGRVTAWRVPLDTRDPPATTRTAERHSAGHAPRATVRTGRVTAWRVPLDTGNRGDDPNGLICALLANFAPRTTARTGRATAWRVPLDTRDKPATTTMTQRRSAMHVPWTTARTGQGAAWRVPLDTGTRRGTTLLAERRSAICAPRTTLGQKRQLQSQPVRRLHAPRQRSGPGRLHIIARERVVVRADAAPRGTREAASRLSLAP